MTLITVCEGAKLELPTKLVRTGLPQRLLRLSEQSKIDIFRRCRGGALQVCAVVGTVTCGEVRIEIWPKTASDDAAHDRTFLLNLLRVAGYLTKYHSAAGGVDEAPSTPIEILIGVIAQDILDGLLQGIPRRYQDKEIESTHVRGQIDFGRLSTRLPSGKTRVPIRHASLSIDNRLSRTIKWVAQALLGLTRLARSRKKLLRILAALSDIDLAKFSESDLENITLSRLEAHWDSTLTVAHLLRQERSFNPTTAGSLSGLTLIFKLHTLFERCLRQFLPLALSPGLSVTHKTGQVFMLKSRQRNESVVRLRPDFVYRKGKTAIAIADAKWKLLNETQKGYGIEPGDLYQAHAYMSLYNVRDTLLLFPRTRWMNKDWSESYQIPETNLKVHLLGVDIESLVSPDEQVSAPALARLTQTIAGFLPAQA